jgi:hypothetical protein
MREALISWGQVWLSSAVSILLPVMAIGTAQMLDSMAGRRQHVWLLFFAGLVVMQFFLSAPHLVRGTHVWSTLAPHVNILRIGFAGMLIGAVILRHDIVRNVRQAWTSARPVGRSR